MAVPCIAWVESSIEATLQATGLPLRFVRSRRELHEALARPCAAIFVDALRLPETGAIGTTIPIIAIIADPLPVAARWLDDFPWVHHIVSESTFAEPRSSRELSALMRTLGGNRRPGPLFGFLGSSARGRTARLLDASRRATRLDRMVQFFGAEGGTGPRAISALHDIAEELLTNAFYDAPVAAGFLPSPVSRAEEAVITPGRACEISYGTADGLAFVRVKDSFGSLSRRRLVEVLKRCARMNMDVTIDGSMGGAGLGLWRIFSQATFLALTVVPTRYTEFLVGVQRRPRAGSPARGPRPYTIHLFFHEISDLAAAADLQAHEGELEASATFQLV